jgi:UDP-N-acetylglucosamine 2-epimerase
MILLAYGTRPEWIKIKPLINEFIKNNIEFKTLFTGQHQDLLKDNPADYRINSIAENHNRLDNIVTSIMNVFSKINYLGEQINVVLVQGDTTSAMAVALSAFHHGIKVAHLEAGLRTYDRENPYPEEINRRIISQIADIHLCPTELSASNLYNERIDDNIHVVGNTVIDNLLEYKDRCFYGNKILITLHRRENHHWIKQWFDVVEGLAMKYPEYIFILPIHPNPNVSKYRTMFRQVRVVDPMEYEKMLDLLTEVRLVITDSGGIQEECSFLNKKCLVCRKETERPEALGQSSFLIETPEDLESEFTKHINTHVIKYDCPFGDGHAAEKIIGILKKSI